MDISHTLLPTPDLMKDSDVYYCQERNREALVLALPRFARSGGRRQSDTDNGFERQRLNGSSHIPRG